MAPESRGNIFAVSALIGSSYGELGQVITRTAKVKRNLFFCRDPKFEKDKIITIIIKGTTKSTVCTVHSNSSNPIRNSITIE